MPSDRHIQLQNMLWTWINNRTVKMAALPECNIVGYVADFVAIARMNDDLHERYCRRSGLKPMWMHKTWPGGMGEPPIYEIYGDIDRHYVCVFEVKVSRADFLNTFGGTDSPHAKARMEPVGTAHWVVADKGVCKPEELPDFWGLLEPYGTGMTETKMPKLNILQESQIHSFAFDMLWLEKNVRGSYYEQLWDMAETIKLVQEAVIRDKPKLEILRRLTKARNACRGMF